MRRTPASVERDLRRIARSPRVEFRTRSMRDAAGSVTFGTNGAVHRIALDPSHGGLIATAVHELLHILLRDELEGRWGLVLEEAIVDALEDRVVRHINRNVARVTWWQALLAKRLT